MSEITRIRRLVPVQKLQHRHGVGGLMLPGSLEIPVGEVAVQIPMGGQPGVPITVLVVPGVPPQIQGLVPQIRGPGRAQVGDMAGVVHPDQAEAPVLPGQGGDGGIAHKGQALHVRQRQPAGPPEKAADGGAVTHHGHGLALMPPGDALHGPLHPFGHLGKGLRPGEREVLGVIAELVHPLRVLLPEIGVEPGLPGADVQLPKLRVRHQAQAVGAGDGRGGVPGPIQIAGIDRVNRQVPESGLQRLHLFFAQLRHAAVPEALHHVAGVSLRVSVTDQINFCHILSLSLTESVGDSIII